MRTNAEIERVQQWALEAIENQEPHYPDIGYEEGVLDAIAWMQGDNERSPDGE